MKLSATWMEEMKRAFRSVSFWISLFFGLILTVTEAWDHYHLVQKGMRMELEKGIASYNPTTAYTTWLPFSVNDWRRVVFYLVLPLLAALPFGVSYWTDRKSGYLKQILLRTEKRYYASGKFLAVFLTGGLAVTLPLLVSFIAATTYLPLNKPDSLVTMVMPLSIGSELLYTHPFLYTVGLLFLTFMTAGSYAILSLAAAQLSNQLFSVFLAPFVISLLIYHTALPLGQRSLVSFYILVPIQNAGLDLWIYSLLLVIFVVVGYIVFYKGLLHDDVF